MGYHLLFYDLVENMVERRVPFRQAHLALVQAAHARGEMPLAGSFGDPVEGAVLVFRTDDPGVVERFAENDPYVQNGLVTSWRVRRWHEVLNNSS